MRQLGTMVRLSEAMLDSYQIGDEVHAVWEGSLMNVYALPGVDLPVDQVLEYARLRGLTGVVVAGWLKEPDEDGNRFYVAASYDAPADVVYVLQRALNIVIDAERQKRR